MTSSPSIPASPASGRAPQSRIGGGLVAADRGIALTGLILAEFAPASGRSWS
jgi:hypothetical protein